MPKKRQMDVIPKVTGSTDCVTEQQIIDTVRFAEKYSSALQGIPGTLYLIDYHYPLRIAFILAGCCGKVEGDFDNFE